MATHISAKIPFTRVIKIAMWNNSSKETMNTIYAKLQKAYPNKLIYMQNAGFFDMTSFKPCWGLKAGGTVVADWWKPTGFIAMNGNKIKLCAANTAFPSDCTDGVSVYPIVIENGKKSSAFHNAPDGYSDRGRTMLGWTDSCIIMSCIADTDGSSDYTLEEEYSYMKSQGCTYSVNLDGGGSSQCNYNGSKITSSRRVNNFIYMVVEPETTKSSSGGSTSGSTSYTSLKAGTVIKLVSGAKYTNGKSVPTWVLNSTLYCRAVYTNGTIAFSTVKSGAITGVVSVNYVSGYTSSSSTGNTSASAYSVKVTVAKLNIRSEASTSGGTKTVTGSLAKGTVVGISSVSGNWGKLSDGRGWIYLPYTAKV